MKLSIVFEADSIEALLGKVRSAEQTLAAAIRPEAPAVETPAVETPAVEAPKRGRKPKAAEPVAAAEPEEVAEENEAPAEAEDDFGFEEDEAPEAVSDKDLLAAFNDFAKRKDGNREKAKALLAKMNVKSVQAIPAEKRAEVLKKLASK